MATIRQTSSISSNAHDTLDLPDTSSSAATDADANTTRSAATASAQLKPQHDHLPRAKRLRKDKPRKRGSGITTKRLKASETPNAALAKDPVAF